MNSFFFKVLCPAAVILGLLTFFYVRIYAPYKDVEKQMEAARAELESYHGEHGVYPMAGEPRSYHTLSDFYAALVPYRDIAVRHFAQSPGGYSEQLKYASNGAGYALVYSSERRFLKIAQALKRDIVLNPEAMLLGYRSPLGPTDGLAPRVKRTTDLKLLRDALAAYHGKYGSYPKSTGFDGYDSRYGAHVSDYIPGLAPEFIPVLPFSIRAWLEGLDFGYLYKSDGANYALMVYDVDYCIFVRAGGDDFYDHGEKCEFAGFFTPGAVGWRPHMTQRRLYDLRLIADALKRYKADHGAYPVSKGLDGYRSDYGDSGEHWIRGLVPGYLDALPRDPRYNEDPANQYLYASNGTDFKLIAHHPDDGDYVFKRHPEMTDPLRKETAYGIWTPGGAMW